MAEPTQTSYALLGLLELQPWTAYDMVGQSRRSLRWFWPRSEAHLYAELKRLVSLGFAEAEQIRVGRRTRTRYSITKAGQQAMRAWLRTPPAPPLLEFQGLVRVIYADQGSVEDLLETLRVVNEQATAMLNDGLEFIREVLDTGGQFPQRLHLNVLLADFASSYVRLILDWTERASTEVATWETTRDIGLTPAGREILTKILEHNQARGRTDGRSSTATGIPISTS